MAEDEAMFDPTKKKKKKKRVLLDLDALEEQNTSSNLEDKSEIVSEADNKDNDVAKDKADEKDIMDLDDFSGLKKKKKKKKKPFDMEGLEDALTDASTDNKSEEVVVQDGEKESQADSLEDLDFNLKKKKRKKKKGPIEDPDVTDSVKTAVNGADSDVDGDDDNEDTGPAWSDRDYTYDELLRRVFDIMRAKNPELVTGEKKKFVMKPPQVVRIGTKKTSFANFTDICKILHRQPKHLLAFLLAELGTSGSIDGNNQLIIKGRFQQKQIENVLRRYIKEYVTCHTCRSPDTILQKETRLFFIQCETCGSRKSVASIKSGFQAITQKRAQLKSKQQ